MKTPLQWIGAMLCVCGLVLAIAPQLASDPGPAEDTFSAIERRVNWGGLAGLGALLMARTRLKPISTTLAAAVLWVVAGYLVARVIGLALDGIDSGLQWMWVGVEAAIVLGAWAFLARRSKNAASDIQRVEDATDARGMD